MTSTAARTGIVVVSHSARLAEGVVELAAQMAPGVTLVPVGGDDDGGLGTSFARIHEAVLEILAAGQDVVVATDLGSATMTAETVLELLEEDQRGRVLLADGPLVEGAVAAAVCAQSGAPSATVRAAVEDAAGSFGPRAVPEEAAADSRTDETGALRRTLTLTNEIGLHARPAALLARAAARYDARTSVNGVDAASVLALMSLGLAHGDTMDVVASGAQAPDVLDAVEELVARDFAEPA